MKVTVEMTYEEIAEFLEFRKAKKINEDAKNRLNTKLNRLANLVLRTVDYHIARDNNYVIRNEAVFVEAVDFAVDCLD